MRRALLALCLAVVAGCGPSQTVDGQAPPSRIPRSLSRIKPEQRETAWTRETLDPLVDRALAAGTPLRPLFHPDLRGYDLPGRLAIGADDVVADVGCGTGALEVELLERGVAFRRLYAIDVDDASLDVLRSLLQKGTWAHRDRVLPTLVVPGQLGVPEASVDVLVVDTAQLHVPPDQSDAFAPAPPSAEVSALLGTLYRAVKPGGRLHVLENLPAGPRPGNEGVRGPYEAAGFRMLDAEVIVDRASPSAAWALRFERPAEATP